MKTLALFALSFLLSSAAAAQICFKAEAPVAVLKPRLCLQSFGFELNSKTRKLVLKNLDGRDIGIHIESFEPCVATSANGNCIGEAKAHGLYSEKVSKKNVGSFEITMSTIVMVHTQSYQQLPTTNDLTAVAVIPSFVLSGKSLDSSSHDPHFSVIYKLEE